MTIGSNSWQPKEYLHKIPSSFVNKQKKTVFNTHTEAFLVIMYKNNFDKWVHMMKYWESLGNYSAELPLQKVDDDGKLLPDVMYEAKYTSKKAGQKRFGSFSDEGILEFQKIVSKIKERRTKHKDHFFKAEKDFLLILQKKNKIGEDGTDGNAKNKKRKAGGGKQPAKRPKVVCIYESDEE